MRHVSTMVSTALLLAATAVAPAGAAVKKMFTTSVWGSAQLPLWAEAQGQSGASAGDQICRTLAGDAGLPNATTYRAWLSTATNDAYCRVAGYSGKRATNCGQSSLPDAGPWERVDGVAFTHSLRELADDWAILHPPYVDESGAMLAPGSVHTGTGSSGTLYTDGHCSGWTTTAGNGRRGGYHNGAFWWTSAALGACSASARLYCFEPGLGDPLPAFEEEGALVFVTSTYGSGRLGDWPGVGAETGLAAGDFICRSRAAAGGLPNPQSFVAWLSTDDVDAIDRVTGNGPFKRVDGVRIAPSKSALVDASVGAYALEATITVDELGEYLGRNPWTGSNTLGERAAENCNGWTSASDAESGQRGYTQETRGYWTTSPMAPDCDGVNNLYCFSSVLVLFWDGFERGGTGRWSN